jgi:hypothetical protein
VLSGSSVSRWREDLKRLTRQMTLLYDPSEKVLQQDILRPAVPAYMNKSGKGVATSTTCAPA